MYNIPPAGFTVRQIPNTPEYKEAARKLNPKDGTRFRIRGRGLPKGAKWRDYQYGTPLRVAPRCAAYQGDWPYLRYECAGITDDGKLRIRALGGER